MLTVAQYIPDFSKVCINICCYILIRICICKLDPNGLRDEKDLSWRADQIIWTFLFSVIVVIAIMGNAMVLWIILAHRTMWSVPNYFLLNLTIADLLMAALNCVPR